MNKAMACAALWLAGATVGHALINPNFTPKDLVGQADLIVAARLKATRSGKSVKDATVKKASGTMT